ncbi:YcaO-like family protein [Mesorhizobium sp. L-8-3]|uniref:YcaO-like family protein n=1 Tax=Mesorhizobium sp. L-8-3 TaxID=2744522 RepID=UPI0019280373|nr:YcaO-like family protein [Mesorhizobium sp. L-8-3]BCH22527.1 methanogenesis marker 1 protein [Mesorhizobium sp. L-8-3]
MYLSDCPLTRGECFVKVSEASGRVTALEETERRVGRLLDAIPVTRVSDISRLELSPAPVMAAITPLARDLTTHMGKGLTVRAARVSAIMEAIERISAETVRGDVRRASYSQLMEQGLKCVDPERFDLPPTTAYRPDLPIDWVSGWDLIGKCEIQVPTDLCVSPPGQCVLDQVDTNGLAAGASFGEAIRHALLEVIERDASSQQLFFELFGTGHLCGPTRKRISRRLLPTTCAELVSRVETDRVSVVLEEITTDIGIPVMACYLIDAAYPAATGTTRVIFGGWGCDPSPEHALNRALTEAHQSRIGTIQGTRDSFNLIQGSDRDFTRQMRGTILKDAPEETLTVADGLSDSIAEDVELIVDRLRSTGVDQAVVVDMSDPSLGVPVVRVRVPGLAMFMVDRCRVGWRCMRHIL